MRCAALVEDLTAVLTDAGYVVTTSLTAPTLYLFTVGSRTCVGSLTVGPPCITQEQLVGIPLPPFTASM